ncbi:MAG TPA: hypothetical protein VJ044_00405 [Candidatus Hodarchaeales archaeon]|nr:hypothetical protein [Candidatus Hodarchaeales archaeon]
MFDSAFTFLEKLLDDLTWRRFINFIIFVLIIVALFFAYEQYTRTLQLNRLRDSISLLKELDSLRPSVQSDSTLKMIYQDIETELREIVARTSIAPQPSSFWLKVLAGASPWLIVMLFFVPGIIRGKHDASVLVGGFMFAAIFGAIATLVPDSWGSTVQFVWYPIGHFVLMVIVLMIWTIRKRG